MKKLIFILSVLTFSFSMIPTTSTAKVKLTCGGKACPDFDNDCCCETGSGNCATPVVISTK